MDVKILLDPEIQAFIDENSNADIRALALKKPPSKAWPYTDIIDQIKARQKAQSKIPDWLEYEDIIFPPSNIVEQASSAATAQYKASLFSGESFVDLTLGAAVDFWAISKNFKHSVGVDHNKAVADLASHNMNQFQTKNTEIIESSAEKHLAKLESADLIYIDPQRRDNSKKGLFKLEDCGPNVIELLPELKKKASTVAIKTSPMLDIAQAVKGLKYVHEIHILEWRNDCKEVLYILKFEDQISADNIPLICVRLNKLGKIDQSFKFTKSEEKDKAPTALPKIYLYEPGPAFQKSGGFNALAHKLNLCKLHQHTHLYTSEDLIKNFPGRVFKIIESLPVNRKSLRLKKANLTIRNFPDKVANLRKKLNIKDGGEDYIFACTNADNEKILLHCKKAESA